MCRYFQLPCFFFEPIVESWVTSWEFLLFGHVPRLNILSQVDDDSNIPVQAAPHTKGTETATASL